MSVPPPNLMAVREDQFQRGSGDADRELAETIVEIYAEVGQPTEADRAWARTVLGIEP
jgi:hypothetical protein